MKQLGVFLLSVGVCLLSAPVIQGQPRGIGRQPVNETRPESATNSNVVPNVPTASAAPATSQAIVPRLVRFNGVLRDVTGKPLSGPLEVTFALYDKEAGGAPLWLETQTVQADEQGRYNALLGAMHEGGLPMELFVSGEARWLGVQVGQEAEQQPRALLVSVAYALKAGDADTLGGKPASAYVLDDTQGTTTQGTTGTTTGTSTASTSSVKNGALPRRGAQSTTALAATSSVVTPGGTANSLAKFFEANTIGNSELFETGGKVGIGTSAPQEKLHILSGADAYIRITGTGQSGISFADPVNGQDVLFYRNVGSRDLNIWTPTAGDIVRFTQLGRVGIGTNTPQEKLEVFNGASDSYMRITGPFAGQTGISFADTTNGQDILFYRNVGSRDLNVWTPTAGDIVRFTQGGSVGFGTPSPRGRLEVNGTSFFDQTATIALGDLSVANGNINVPLTINGGGAGVITLNGSSFIHACCSAGATQNTFIGFQSGNFTMTGAGNLGMGGQALFLNAGGSFNTAIGLSALRANTEGQFNTAGGNVALQSNTTGSLNTALGRGALQLNTTGTNNTALGNQAGAAAGTTANTTGSNNTFVGAGAGISSSSQLTNATALGYNAVVSANSALVLGGLGLDAVKVGIGIAVPATTLDVVGDIHASGCFLAGVSSTPLGGTCSSDARLKTNIEPFSPVLAKLVLLHPVHYDWKVAEYPDYHFGSGRSSGVIAQEVEKLFPELVSTDKRGFKQVNYSELPYLMLQAISELKQDNDNLRDELKLLAATKDGQISKLTQQVRELQRVKNEMTALEARLTRVESGSLVVARRKANHAGTARVKVAYRAPAPKLAALRASNN